MPSLGKLSSWIEVDGNHLPEFGSEVSDDVITCWVPSEVGKEFAICWRDPNLEYTQRGNVFVDGQLCRTLMAIYPDMKGVMVARVAAARTGPTTSRALIFSDIDLTDDDRYLQPSSDVENIGEIKLVVSEATITGVGTFGNQSMHLPADRTKVHERTKKGMDHCVGFGETRPVSSGLIFNQEIRTVATFIFRYRPLGKPLIFLATVLQANGIAPVDKNNKRKASAPLEEPSEDEKDKAARAAEIEALETRLSDLKGYQNKRVKTEVKTVSLLRPRPVKKPRCDRPY
ncbi:hypothetical protein BDN72DRAFT_897072 [Pluteus cervinus]|uniref:Uncharacterized protein n=1 Tax=Pluteus cervinus TaxID=181527 RepID=A0ACD3AVU8_9AGAR|nr:hypothetical protein BDN72DRAFT_897072 [Pluteus cervinus]